MEEDFIDACDVLQELCGLLSGYRYELHYHDNGEYEYLNETGVCITIFNPYSENKMYIDLQEEFTLSYGAYLSTIIPTALTTKRWSKL